MHLESMGLVLFYTSWKPGNEMHSSLLGSMHAHVTVALCNLYLAQCQDSRPRKSMWSEWLQKGVT